MNEGTGTLTEAMASLRATLGCAHCGGPLGDSPTSDFCREDCQHAWHHSLADPAPLGPDADRLLDAEVSGRPILTAVRVTFQVAAAPDLGPDGAGFQPRRVEVELTDDGEDVAEVWVCGPRRGRRGGLVKRWMNVVYGPEDELPVWLADELR